MDYDKSIVILPVNEERTNNSIRMKLQKANSTDNSFFQ